MASESPSILAFAGALREGSFNKKLVRIAVEGARAKGAEVTLVDLRDYPMPPYDGDLEAAKGLPQPTLELKELFAQHQGLLISTPEYNFGVPGTLKNVIDWVSRKGPGESANYLSFKGRIAAVLSASPGLYGGVRALTQLRSVLFGTGVTIISESHSLVRAGEAFDEQDRLKNADLDKQVRHVGARLAQLTAALTAPTGDG